MNRRSFLQAIIAVPLAAVALPKVAQQVSYAAFWKAYDACTTPGSGLSRGVFSSAEVLRRTRAGHLSFWELVEVLDNNFVGGPIVDRLYLQQQLSLPPKVPLHA